jgi:hypothetical protein
MRPKEVRRRARREAERNALPLQPTMGPYPSEIAAVIFSPVQQLKVDEVVDKAIARARKPYLTWCMLMKRALDQGAQQLFAMRKLLTLY